jgi:hypothetical protein
MGLDIAGWLINSETDYARISIGQKWPGGYYAEPLVKMIDTHNAIRSAVAAERERCARLCEFSGGHAAQREHGTKLAAMIRGA